MPFWSLLGDATHRVVPDKESLHELFIYKAISKVYFVYKDNVYLPHCICFANSDFKYIVGFA